jgi:hypothetical protein
LGVVVAIACALALPAALEAATGKHKPACPPGTKPAPHGRCRTRLPKPSAASPLSALEQLSWAAATAGSPPPVRKGKAKKVPKPLRKGLPALVTNHSAKTALQRAFNVSVANNGLAKTNAARASSTTTSGSEAGPSMNGWQTQLSGNSTRDDSRIGLQDTDATVTATKDAKVDDVKLNGTIALEMRNKQLVDRCPNADGTVPGDGLNLFKLQFDVSAGNAQGQISGSGTGYVDFKWTYVGHVADNGTLTSFDVKMKATTLVEGGIRGADGKLYSVEAPKLYTVSSEIDDIDPNHPEAVKQFDMDLGGRAQMHSFLGFRYYEDNIAKGLVDVVEKLMSFNVLEIARYYKEAEANWQTPGNCVTVTPTATDTTLKPGQQEPVTVTITGPPQKGKGTAPGRFTATASAGTISPSSGTYTPGRPLSLTFTAPQSGTAGVTIQTISRQGKGSGSLTFNVKNPSYKLEFTSSGQLQYSGTPEQVAAAPTQGTETRNEQWQVSTTIPLTGDPATGLSGSAPIDYQQAAYHLEWDGWFSGQAGFYSCYGFDKTDLVSTAPGVAKVYKLTVASPTSATLAFNPGDPWSTETMTYDDENPGDAAGNGKCPGGNGTLPDGNRWWSEDMYFYSQQGLETYDQGHQEVKIDSEWQPGGGDVVATRTISGSFPWSGAPGTPTAGTWADTYKIVLSSS